MKSRSEADVVEANRRFYDQIASVYDEVDSRRRDGTDYSWLDRTLEEVLRLATRTSPGRPTHFLDAGTGSGLIARRIGHRFDRVTLVDVSRAMLDRIPLPGAVRICGDVCQMPIEGNCVDAVAAFATLHHLHDPVRFFAEAARVLRPGGVLYTDHDIEARFVERFAFPLRTYRYLFDHGRRYLRRCPGATARDYELSEFHGARGLPGRLLERELHNAGFDVVVLAYHWEGMGVIAQLLGATGALSRPGWSPILRTISVKRSSRKRD